MSEAYQSKTITFFKNHFCNYSGIQNTVK